MPIASVNPATGETWRTFEPHSPAEVERRVAAAHERARSWRRTPFAERARLMNAAARLLGDEQAQLARTMALEMGKPVKAGRAEAAKCATTCRYYAENAERFLADEPAKTEAADSRVVFQPLGVVLAVMPWNFPLWQVFRFAAPALMAGNVGLLKHASNVPQCALAIEDIFRRAGFPDGCFTALLIGADRVPALLADARVAAATLTGSVEAGRSIAAEAGRHLKKTVLELGGSDPFVVMPSADVARAADAAVKARTINSGQSCIAAKRFIVHERVYDAFVERFVAGMRALKVGDPLDEANDVGPQASEALAKELDAQVRASVAAGARVLCGGTRDRAYYAPTVLADIPRGSPAYQDELFGPVASLFKARDLDEAIRLANDTVFGLGASAWTSDVAEQQRFVAELDAGAVFINAMVASDPRLPFGGVKDSGYGRELSSFGLREFVNAKTVWVAG